MCAASPACRRGAAKAERQEDEQGQAGGDRSKELRLKARRQEQGRQEWPVPQNGGEQRLGVQLVLWRFIGLGVAQVLL